MLYIIKFCLMNKIFSRWKRKSIAQLLEENWQRIYELETLMEEARKELNMQEDEDEQ